MADGGEILATSKFYLEFEGITELIVKKISGLSIKLEAAGDMKSFGVRKEAVSFMQATVSGVTSGVVTVEFVATVEDHSMHNWYRDSHSIGGATAGKGSSGGGVRKSGSLTVFNQAGKAAARWNFSGIFPKSYKTSKMEPGGTELFTEKVEFVYETCHRVKPV